MSTNEISGLHCDKCGWPISVGKEHYLDSKPHCRACWVCFKPLIKPERMTLRKGDIVKHEGIG